MQFSSSAGKVEGRMWDLDAAGRSEGQGSVQAGPTARHTINTLPLTMVDQSRRRIEGEWHCEGQICWNEWHEIKIGLKW